MNATPKPEAGAQCVSSARQDLCGDRPLPRPFPFHGSPGSEISLGDPTTRIDLYHTHTYSAPPLPSVPMPIPETSPLYENVARTLWCRSMTLIDSQPLPPM